MKECAVELSPAGLSAFGRVALEIDRAEVVGWDRPGGSSCADDMRIQRCEARLSTVQPQTLSDWQWLARRIGRAVENGWSKEAAAPLLRLAS